MVLPSQRQELFTVRGGCYERWQVRTYSYVFKRGQYILLGLDCGKIQACLDEERIYCPRFFRRVSDLIRGKVDKFTIDMLVNILTKLGHKVTMRIA